MTAIIVFCSLSCLLFFGKILRMKLRLLQRLYLPSSVVGGLIGLALVQCLGSHLPAELWHVVQQNVAVDIGHDHIEHTFHII